MAGVKFLLSGLERSGKTRVISKLENAFVLNCDAKQFAYSLPHTNLYTSDYKGIEAFRTMFRDKMETYKKNFKSYPKTIVVDTITQLYNQMHTYSIRLFAGDKNGYAKNAFLIDETFAFNVYIEDTLIKNGFNVVIVAHTQIDKATGKFYIPAVGKFRETGSWLSVVDNASYVEVIDGQFIIKHTDFNYPCRTSLEGLPVSQPTSEYDINEHIKRLTEVKLDNQQFVY